MPGSCRPPARTSRIRIRRAWRRERNSCARRGATRIPPSSPSSRPAAGSTPPAAARGSSASGSCSPGSGDRQRRRLLQHEEQRAPLARRAPDGGHGAVEADPRVVRASGGEADRGHARPGAPGVPGRLADRERAVGDAGRARPRARGAARIPDPLRPVAAGLRRADCVRPPVDLRRDRDPFDVRLRAGHQRLDAAVRLRGQPRQRSRPGPCDRLQPVRRIAVPGGACRRGRRP